VNADELRRWDELVDRGVAPRVAAELAQELGDPADAPRGCLLGAVVVAVLLLLAVVGVGAAAVFEWL
jgi:hypothetical protein